MNNEVPIELYRTTNNEFVKYVRYDDYKKLEDILKEVREYVNNRINYYREMQLDFGKDFSQMWEDIEPILEILDKGE